jgi:aspartate aminotransferase
LQRTLGFVNAPALFQKVVGDALAAKVNIEDLRQKGIIYTRI